MFAALGNSELLGGGREVDFIIIFFLMSQTGMKLRVFEISDLHF